MKFARRVFWWSGLYGLVALVPQYALEGKIGVDAPPPITHPEFFYGFIGVALAWQAAFFIIAKDPVRFRPLMIPAFLEKFLFTAATVILFAQGRLSGQMLAAGLFDLVLALLFVAAYRASRPAGVTFGNLFA